MASGVCAALDGAIVGEVMRGSNPVRRCMLRHGTAGDGLRVSCGHRRFQPIE
jgi:hypothetical protein